MWNTGIINYENIAKLINVCVCDNGSLVIYFVLRKSILKYMISQFTFKWFYKTCVCIYVHKYRERKRQLQALCTNVAISGTMLISESRQ